MNNFCYTHTLTIRSLATQIFGISIALALTGLLGGCRAVEPVNVWQHADTTQWVAFCSNRKGDPGDFDLFMVRLDGSGLRRLTQTVGQEFDPAVSPDGKHIAFAYRPKIDHGPALKKLAFVTSELHVINWNGSDRQKLGSWRGLVTEPCWSPDGQLIAFSLMRSAGTNPDGTQRLDSRVLLVDKSGVFRESLGAGAFPSWSPDGRRLLVSQIDPETHESQLVIIDVATKQRRSFSKPGPMMGRWSPDGQHIAFVIKEGTDTRPTVCLIRSDKTGSRELTFGTNSTDANFSPRWSRDGRSIFFTRMRYGRESLSTGFISGILAVDSDGQNLRQIVKMDAQNLLSGGFVASSYTNH